MKRCSECNRITTDDALVFCRADGARLVQDSGSFSDSETVALLHEPIAPTSSMSASLPVPAAPTRPLVGSKKRQAWAALLVALIVLSLAVSTYDSRSRKNNTAISSLAILPFVNVNAD